MNMSTTNFDVLVAPEIELSLSIGQMGDLPQTYSAGLYRRGAQQLAFTSFELREVRIEFSRVCKARNNFGLWIGRTCYELPLESMGAVAAFLGVAIPDSEADAS